MRAEAAGKQAIAISDVHRVAAPAPGGSDRARDELRPRFDVMCGVADDGWFPRRSAGSMNAGDLVPRHRKHAERIAVPQIFLGREREVAQVIQRAQVFRMNPGQLAFTAVGGDIRVRVAYGPFQARELQRSQLILTRTLYGLKFGMDGAVGGPHSGGSSHYEPEVSRHRMKACMKRFAWRPS